MKPSEHLPTRDAPFAENKRLRGVLEKIAELQDEKCAQCDDAGTLSAILQIKVDTARSTLASRQEPDHG